MSHDGVSLDGYSLAGPARLGPAALQRIRNLVALLSQHKDHLVIDADVHASDVARLAGPIRDRYSSTPDYYHGRPISAEDVLAEMRLADVDMALIWQNPAATRYVGNAAEDFQALLAANRHIGDSASRYPDKFIPAGWTDPRACGLEGALKLVDIFVLELGFVVVKLNPAQNRFPIDSEPALAIVDRIVELGAIPAFHFGADTPFTPAEGLARVAARYPKHPLLAIHMGGGGAGYVEADELCIRTRTLGLQHPNLHFVMSAKRETHIESDLIAYQLAGAPFCHNLSCGSDTPYGKMAWNFGGYRALFKGLLSGRHHTDPRVRSQPHLFDEQAVTNYMGRNFAELVIAGGRRLLSLQGQQEPR